ncbi:hypothetical protein XELAEV_18043072mg [Xenopus laevis]|uniref:Uncharacterized protein n=1 Tax=Xenopus laevis TaxID=8355 RepID=A0A974BW91_XENLA|nr:hypothetical protein XELAEV_18043072mg [Xenopus laevis]
MKEKKNASESGTTDWICGENVLENFAPVPHGGQITQGLCHWHFYCYHVQHLQAIQRKKIKSFNGTFAGFGSSIVFSSSEMLFSSFLFHRGVGCHISGDPLWIKAAT